MMNYSKLLQVILDIAEEMLICGAEVERVEDSIERMCYAYDCRRVNAFIITSNIQVTFEDPEGNIITQIRRIVRNDTNFDRLDYLNDLSRYICAGKPELPVLIEKYESVMNRKQLPLWVDYLGAIMVASGFAVFFGGTIADGAWAAVLAVVITTINKFLGRYEKNAMALVFIESLAAGFVAILPAALGITLHTDRRNNAPYTGNRHDKFDTGYADRGHRNRSLAAGQFPASGSCHSVWICTPCNSDWR